MTADRSSARRGPVSDALKREILAHYEGQLVRHGPTPEGMDWKDEASQKLRFEVLCGVSDFSDRSVHEVACGAGHLWDFIQERGLRPSAYSGSDLSLPMIEAARGLHPGVSFEQRDFLLEPVAESYDIVLCSGLFHVKLDRSADEFGDFVREFLRRMYSLCRVAIAFNLMSDHVDYRADSLFYPDTDEMLHFCRSELSRFVTLRHDYPLYESTLYVYRSPQ